MKRKKQPRYTKRSSSSDLSYRSFSIRKDISGAPSTIDEEARSVQVIGATEDPVEVMDYDRYEPVMEVLLMSGLEMPKTRQVPLLDSHRRWDGAGSVMGSYRDMDTSGGQLTGTVIFSSAPEVEGVWTRVREGHVTDFSVGYRVIDSVFIETGRKKTIKGRTYSGPVRVTTRWRIKELSVTPIGADEKAKARSEKLQAKEQIKMNGKLRKILEKRGLGADADDSAAWAFFDDLFSRGEINADGSTPETNLPAAGASWTDPAPARSAAPTSSGKDPATDAVAAERARIAEITSMADRFGLPAASRAELIGSGASIDDARSEVLDFVAKNKQDPKVPAREAVVYLDERDKFRDAAADACLIRSGVAVSADNLAAGASELAGYTMIEMARHSLMLAGGNPRGDIRDVIGRSLTTSDFPLILAAVANKSLFLGWENSGETWQTWCSTGSVNDFKEHKSVRVSEFADLEEVPEDAEYKYGKRTEAQEAYKIATYGKLGAVSRQTIINDDLNAITTKMMGMGEAAARKIGDLPYAVLTANADMGDGNALFSSAHSNYVADGSGAPPGVSPISAGILAMGTQKDLQNKRRLNIRPEFFIAPKALEGVAEVFFRSERFVDSDTVATDSSLAATRANPYSGNYFTRVYDARLDDDDPAAWYLAARKGKTVVIYFLGGIRAPYFEVKNGWSVDGTEYKVRIDAGAKALDWRGLYYNDGN